MRSKITAPNALKHIEAISRFIAKGNKNAALRYVDAVFETLDTLPDDFLPVRANPHLPENVRKVSVQGFPRYMLYLVYEPERISLIAAFRPGLTETMQSRRSHKGIREIRDL